MLQASEKQREKQSRQRVYFVTNLVIFFSLPPLLQACSPASRCPYMGALLFPFGPIRQLDASLLEMPWARARPEASVRGATGWLVTRGKGFRSRGGNIFFKYQEDQVKQSSRGQTGSRYKGEGVLEKSRTERLRLRFKLRRWRSVTFEPLEEAR